MTLSAKLKSEAEEEIPLTLTRVDQRVTLQSVEYTPPGREIGWARPEFSKRIVLFILTGRATQAEKEALEGASRNWWTKGEGSAQGRVRFLWGDATYNCYITKADFSKDAAAEKYDYLIELKEADFT